MVSKADLVAKKEKKTLTRLLKKEKRSRILAESCSVMAPIGDFLHRSADVSGFEDSKGWLTYLRSKLAQNVWQTTTIRLQDQKIIYHSLSFKS